MKILLIGWGYKENTTGGLDTHITNITKELAILGEEIYLFLPKSETKYTQDQNIRIREIELYTPKQNMQKLIEEYNIKIIKETENEQFDIIHTHDWLGSIAGYIISKQKNIPWIHTVHSLEYMRKGDTEPEKSDIEEIEMTAIRDSDKIITVSSLMKQEITTHYKIDPKKIEIIYNHTSRLNPPQKNPYPENLKDSPKIIAASRLTHQKGLEHLIYASPKILEKHPKTRFIIIGEGHLKESLKEFTELLNIRDAFIFTGFIPQKELSSYMKPADIFIMPSTWEPFGIAALDALELEIPSIISENTGALEIIKDAVITHKPSSSKEISEKILYLLENKNKAEELKKRSKETMKQLDTWQTIAKKTQKIYQLSLTSSRSPAE